MTLITKLEAAADVYAEAPQLRTLLLEAAAALTLAESAMTLADRLLAERERFDREQADREAWELFGDERWTLADPEPMSEAEMIQETLARR